MLEPGHELDIALDLCEEVVVAAGVGPNDDGNIKEIGGEIQDDIKGAAHDTTMTGTKPAENFSATTVVDGQQPSTEVTSDDTGVVTVSDAAAATTGKAATAAASAAADTTTKRREAGRGSRQP
ncbi:unnamed protein product [Phytophthora fragariaefolia]|uniref:Unnamed protein product n=1 Tax=Phytophthora fragariaefolia TaxID=1490495 RepID=A0A9W6YBH8_9STRA|nr:unnamed protein product [Phytophthora fragariaefolia]